MNTINPLWTAYNTLQNEGGEGFNPHSKFIDSGRGEPLWSKLGNQAYRLQNRINGTSHTDPDLAAMEAEYKILRAAEADAISRDI